MKNLLFYYLFIICSLGVNFPTTVLGMDPDVIHNIQRKTRLIIAEDTSVMQTIYKRLLSSYELTFVNDGKELCERFSPGLFDLIITDGKMPIMDGHTAIGNLIAKHGKDKLPPILAISSDASEEDKNKFLIGGASSFVPKPINKKMLLEAIDRLLLPEPFEGIDDVSPHSQS